MEKQDLIGKLDELIAQHADELERLKAARLAYVGEQKPEATVDARKRDTNGLTSGQRAAQTRKRRAAGRKAAETRRRNAANDRAAKAAVEDHLATPDGAHEEAIRIEEDRAKAAGEVPAWAA